MVNKALSDEITKKAKAFIETYNEDVKETFIDEFLLFSSMFPDRELVAELLAAQVENKLVMNFPNVNIAFRIYLSILGSSAEGECSFLKLNCIKNHLCSTLSQAKLP